MMVVLLGCGNNKVTNPDQDRLIGQWLYESTLCSYYSNKLFDNDVTSRNINFMDDGKGTLYYFYNGDGHMSAEFNWSIESDQLICGFHTLNRDTTAIEILTMFSDEYSCRFSVTDSTLELFDSDLASSCFSVWIRVDQ